MEQKIKRDGFSSTLAVFFATLGSAVGLGNIWKFPYLTGQNGGGAFVLAYLICVILIGMPVMISEFFMGRKTRKNAVGAIQTLKSNQPIWKSIGYFGILASFLIMFFYSAVAGWVYSYVFKALKGDFSSLASLSVEEAAKVASDQFGATVAGTFSPMLWQIIVIIVVSAILIAGVKNGIERITKTLMPVLFILIIICDIRALTLPGAKEGLNFLFHVDFAKLTPPVMLSALGLAFFKLSLGMGTMMTYGSYFTDNTNLISTSAKVAISDTAVSLLAGISIFPVVFTFGLKPEAGASLLFNTVPLVFSRLPFGNLLLVSFFILTSIAATTAMISLMEVPVAYLSEEKKLSRNKAVLLISSVILLVGLITVHPKSLLGGIVIAGKGFFDWFDFISSNIILPIGGMMIALLVGHFISKTSVEDELSNKGTLNNGRFLHLFFPILKYVTPILLIIVFLNSIGVIKL